MSFVPCQRSDTKTVSVDWVWVKQVMKKEAKEIVSRIEDFVHTVARLFSKRCFAFVFKYILAT